MIGWSARLSGGRSGCSGAWVLSPVGWASCRVVARGSGSRRGRRWAATVRSFCYRALSGQITAEFSSLPADLPRFIPPAAMISLQTLGSVGLRKDATELSTILAQPKRLALLVYLASARPRGFHSRDALLALFWPEADGERARNSLRQALHHLRRSLGEDAIPGRGDREVGVDPALLQCDAADFDAVIEGERWEEALGLYRGDFLPALFVQDAPEAERWIEDERARRRRDAIDAARRLAEAAERSGDASAAVRWARTAAALEPGDEASLRRLVTLLDAAGDRAGAIEAYDEFVRRLTADYGVGPSAESVALIERVRAGKPVGGGRLEVGASPVAGVALREDSAPAAFSAVQ